MTKVEEVARAQSMVERVASAMAADEANEHAFWAGDNTSGWRCLAMAAIQAMREPTAGMVDAGAENVIGPCDVSYVFQAMIDAALGNGA